MLSDSLDKIVEVSYHFWGVDIACKCRESRQLSKLLAETDTGKPHPGLTIYYMHMQEHLVINVSFKHICPMVLSEWFFHVVNQQIETQTMCKTYRKYPYLFFPSGHSNESYNLIGS